MSQENEIEAKKLSPTTDFLPSDGASCSPSFIAQAKKFCEGIAMLSDGEIVCKLADILAARSAAVTALRHCRLFIVDRKGYTNDEDVERETLKRTIDSILSENVKSTHGARKESL